MAGDTEKVTKSGKKVKKWYKKKYNVAEIASKAWQGVKLLRELVNAEKKFFDSLSVGNISWNGGIVHLTNILQGDLSNQRNGKSVLLNGFLLRLILRRNNLSTGPISARVIVFQDLQLSGNPLIPAEVQQNIGGTNAVVQPINQSLNGRIKVLFNRSYDLDSNEQQSQIKLYLKLRNHLKWNFNSTSPDKNHIYIMLISDVSPTDSNNLPAYNLFARTYYYDN